MKNKKKIIKEDKEVQQKKEDKEDHIKKEDEEGHQKEEEEAQNPIKIKKKKMKIKKTMVMKGTIIKY